MKTFYSQQLIPQPPSSRLPCRAMLCNGNKLTPRPVTQALTPFIRGIQAQVKMTGLAMPTEVCDPSTLKVLPVFYKEQQRPQPRGDRHVYQEPSQSDLVLILKDHWVLCITQSHTVLLWVLKFLVQNVFFNEWTLDPMLFTTSTVTIHS